MHTCGRGLDHSWFGKWFCICSAPNHDTNQWCLILIWTNNFIQMHVNYSLQNVSHLSGLNPLDKLLIAHSVCRFQTVSSLQADGTRWTKPVLLCSIQWKYGRSFEGIRVNVWHIIMIWTWQLTTLTARLWSYIFTTVTYEQCVNITSVRDIFICGISSCFYRRVLD